LCLLTAADLVADKGKIYISQSVSQESLRLIFETAFFHVILKKEKFNYLTFLN